MSVEATDQNTSNEMRVFYVDSSGMAFRTLHDNIFLKLREIIRNYALNEERNVRLTVLIITDLALYFFL